MNPIKYNGVKDMGVIIEVDYHNGAALPDGKAVEWATNLVNQATYSNEVVKASASTNMMIVAIQVASKGKPDGFTTLHYLANDVKVEIDSDGNLKALSGLKEERLLEDLLMRIF